MSKNKNVSSDILRMSEYVRNMNPEQAKSFIRSVIGPPKRQLAGRERDQAWTVIQLSSPVRESNNQRFWYEEYLIGGKRYDVTYGVEDRPIIEVYEDETN